MTPAELATWRKQHGFTQEEAGNRLGVSKRSISAYESVGPVPKAIALACSAISNEETKLDYLQLVREQYPKLGGVIIVIPFIAEKGNGFQDAVQMSFSPEISNWLQLQEFPAQMVFTVVITPSRKKLVIPIVVFEDELHAVLFKTAWM